MTIMIIGFIDPSSPEDHFSLQLPGGWASCHRRAWIILSTRINPINVCTWITTIFTTGSPLAPSPRLSQQRSAPSSCSPANRSSAQPSAPLRRAQQPCPSPLLRRGSTPPLGLLRMLSHPLPCSASTARMPLLWYGIFIGCYYRMVASGGGGIVCWIGGSID